MRSTTPSARSSKINLKHRIQSVFAPTSRTSTTSSEPPAIVVFSFLGVPSAKGDDDGHWMVIDWLMWTSLLTSQPRFDAARFRFYTIRDPLPMFPSATFIFGEASSTRLRIPIPLPLYDKAKSAEIRDPDVFKRRALNDLERLTGLIQPGETFYVLLVGHGQHVPGSQTSEGKFRLCISTVPDRRAEAYLSKIELQDVLVKCAGTVVLICNACHSGALSQGNPPWRLLCSTQANELADGLSQSASGAVRGSVWTHCFLIELASEQGLVIPLPRADPIAAGPWVPLPDSPPEHSFTSPIPPPRPPSSGRNMASFVDRMMGHSRYLLEPPRHNFHHHGFGEEGWYNWLPLELSQKLVQQFQLVPDNRSVDGLTKAQIMTAIYSSVVDSSPSTHTLLLPSLTGGSLFAAISPIPSTAYEHLLILAPLFLSLPSHRSNRDARARSQCHLFLASSKTEENQLPQGQLEDLAEALRTEHVQSVFLQLLARRLSWSQASSVFPLLSAEAYEPASALLPDMQAAGFEPIGLFLSRYVPW
ncbi:hypothetical protein B0H16DRAFT_297758 [Mycena metata]|uniref:Uncharacterized protein n=1 Tax=Mycena metata TaxID=1033252 RepID=A0AAD7KG04_9AGAR|nr:hypothetical protein B0H16DRAFT_297758 [Mycena metata]